MDGLSTWFWFDGTAEEAATFYAELFGGEVTEVQRIPDEVTGSPGGVVTASFRIFGHEFHAFNGGTLYQPTAAVSFMVPCDGQPEIDRVWAALADGGTELQCGWVTDRFGITWQVVPSNLQQLLSGEGDLEASRRVWQTLMPMVKIEVAALEAALRG